MCVGDQVVAHQRGLPWLADREGRPERRAAELGAGVETDGGGLVGEGITRAVTGGNGQKRIGRKVDDNLKQALLDRFGAWLDKTEDAPALCRMTRRKRPTCTRCSWKWPRCCGGAAWRSRLVKDALEQFRGIFRNAAGQPRYLAA